MFGWSAWQVSPSVPGGDEPHYLVITQSLLLDRDLKIENNHRRGDYQAYCAGPLAPHYIQRGRNGEIYSIHAPGLSAIVAPAFLLGGYRAVVLFLLALAACGSALAWHLAWLATRSAPAAWFGWAAVTTSATAIFHSFTVYPDGLGGVIVLTGIWALFRAALERTTGETRLRPWLLHGAALALLPWLHSRFALLAGSLGALVLLRLAPTRNPAAKAVAFLSVPAISALVLDRIVSRDLWQARSVSAVRDLPRLFHLVHSGRTCRAAVRSALRAHRQRSGAPVWRRRADPDDEAASLEGSRRR